MVYSTYPFLFLFLPIVLLVYYELSRFRRAEYQKVFLILASLFFYGYYNWHYLFIILSSIVVNYLLARAMQQKRSKIIFVLGILFNTFLLGYFKYFDFFITNINAVFRTSFLLRNIVLPLGISFFTFQQLSFLISIYKKEENVESFLDYCLFVTFFPQLVAGPIVLYSEMIPQFQDDSRRFFHPEHFCQGFYLFCIGAFKKVVIADTVAVFVDNGFGMSELGLAAAWATALSYTFQIYFDFSGYSDMAIGLGRMFNINIPENFRSPYQSKSIAEFWRRWHITLGRALSTYIYIPLGGSRKGLPRTCLNLLITFLVSGIWHGAAWTFVLWGVLHGVLVALERVFQKHIQKIPDAIRVAVTFLMTNALWVLFRAESFQEAFAVYRGMLNIRNVGLLQLQKLAEDSLINFPGIVDMIYVPGILVLLFLLVFKGKSSMERKENFTISRKTALEASFCLIFALICISRGSVFIYFNF